MITVKVGQLVKCNTIGHSSSGVIGILERICDTSEDKAYGLGPSYGIVNGIACNLHNCVVIETITLDSQKLINLINDFYQQDAESI